MWFKVKSTKLHLSDGVHRIQNKVKGQWDISSKWNTTDMENPNSINLSTLVTVIICSLVLHLCTCAIFLFWLKMLENLDSIFCIFVVIYLASHLTGHLALNFSQSRCSVNIDHWRSHTVSKSLLQLTYVLVPIAYWSLTNHLCNGVVLGSQVFWWIS